jgi:hypothetical protein
MQLTNAGKITDIFMAKLMEVFPEVKWKVETKFDIIRYMSKISWEEGPDQNEVIDALRETNADESLMLSIYIVYDRTYQNETVLKTAQVIADSCWVQVPLNLDNIKYLKVHDVTIEKLAMDELKRKSFKSGSKK